MRIIQVECHRVPVPGPKPPFAWRQGLPGSWPDGEGAVLRICTDDGAEGVAFAPRKGVIVQNVVDRVLREELIGADPLQREWLWHRVWELDRPPGEVTVRCQLPPARLASGGYSIDLITAVSGNQFLDYIESGLTFAVDSPAIGDRNWLFRQSMNQGYTVWDVTFRAD